MDCWDWEEETGGIWRMMFCSCQFTISPLFRDFPASYVEDKTKGDDRNLQSARLFLKPQWFSLVSIFIEDNQLQTKSAREGKITAPR